MGSLMLWLLAVLKALRTVICVTFILYYLVIFTSSVLEEMLGKSAYEL